MDKREFIGELSSISPSALANPEEENRLQSFFLILALIYNDLKGLLLFREIIKSDYREPGKDEVSFHMGEYSGLLTQNNKLLIATIAEFLSFLEQNRDVTSLPLFLLLSMKLSPEKRKLWNELLVPSRNTESIISKISRIRSNVAFHYDHSAKELRRGFIRSFFRDRKDLVQHQRAYYSLGNTMKTTRFFYADAALEDYIQSLLSGEERNNVEQVVSNMNLTIQALVANYIHSIKVK